ncbi:MAG: flippase [Candidatus Altimarinota bacterium]
MTAAIKIEGNNKGAGKSQTGVARKILLNTATQVIAKLIIGLFSVVILKLLTTYLGKSGYGFYKSIFEFLAFFAIVADLGLYTIGVREMSRDPSQEGKVLGNLMTIRTAMIILIGGVAVAASFLVGEFQGSIAPIAVGVAALATVFAILTGTVSTALQVHLKMEWNSLGSVLGKLVTLGWMLFVILYWFPHNCSSDLVQFLSGSGACSISNEAFLQLIAAGLLGNIVMFLVTFYFTNKLVKVSYRFDLDFIREVIWKALPYGLALVLNQIYFRIGSMVLLNTMGSDAVAIYSAPLTILEAAGIIPLYFMNAILPFLTRTIKDGKGEHKRIIQLSFDFLMMSALPIVAGTLALAYQMIFIIATPEFLSNTAIGFYGSDIVLQILIIALFFSFLNGLFGYILIASDHQDTLLPRNFIGAIVTVVLTLVLVPHLGERGAAIANVVTEFYIFAASFLLAKKFVDFKIDLSRFWKMLLSTVVMGAAVWYLKDISFYWFGLGNKNVALLIPLGGVIYVVMLLLTGALTKEMIDMIKKRKVVQATATSEAGPGGAGNTGGAAESAGAGIEDSE